MRTVIGKRWWFFLGGVVVITLALWAFQALRGSTLTRQDMVGHLDFPATYNGRDDVFTGAFFTLREDGTAGLHGVALGTGEASGGGERRCLVGDVQSVTGEAKWWADDSGWVIIEAEGRRSRFHPDDALVMADGWGKVYLLTPCTQEYAATFVTADADYPG